VNWFLIQLRDAIGETKPRGIGTLLTLKEAKEIKYPEIRILLEYTSNIDVYLTGISVKFSH
jgi:hypothetical protein